MKTPSLALLVLVSSLAIATSVEARRKPVLEEMLDAARERHSVAVPAAGSVEVAFSPDEGAEHLVVKVIDSARKELRVLSYSFTSIPVVQALIRARHRGVDVKIVADAKDNLRMGNIKARAALGALVNAGCEVRTISADAIHHDKVIIADQSNVELGSFNFSEAAAHRNSENVLVNWRNPGLAEAYLRHFARNYGQSVAYQQGY